MIASRPVRAYTLLLIPCLLVGGVGCGKAAISTPAQAPSERTKSPPPESPDGTTTKSSPATKEAPPKASLDDAVLKVDLTEAKALYETIGMGNNVVYLADGSTGECGPRDSKAALASRRLLKLPKTETCATKASVKALAELLKDGRQPERTATALKHVDSCAAILADLTTAVADSALCSPWEAQTREADFKLGHVMTLAKALTLITFEKASREGSAKALEFALDVLQFAQRAGRGNADLLQALTLQHLTTGPLAVAIAARSAKPIPTVPRRALAARLRGIVKSQNHFGHIIREEFAAVWRNVQASLESGTAGSSPELLDLPPAMIRAVMEGMLLKQGGTLKLCPLDKPDSDCMARLAKHSERLAKDKVASTNALVAAVGSNPSPKAYLKVGPETLVPLIIGVMRGATSSMGQFYSKLAEGRLALKTLAEELAQ